MKYIITLLLLLGVLKNSLAQEKNVSNIRVSQEGNKIIINYDLKNSAYISLLVSEDDKQKLGFKLTGDIGYVEVGNSKKIMLVPESEIFVCQGCIFKIVIGGFNFQVQRIGHQLWQDKNLDVSMFRNGDDIPEAKTNEEWVQAAVNKWPAWCYYDNDAVNGKKFGKLYNWYAVNDPRGLAPVGLHIPSEKEWQLLTNYLGGDLVAGEKMKIDSSSNWNSVSNSSGFSAVLGGFRNNDGKFKGVDNYGYWWSSTDISIKSSWYRFLNSYLRGIVSGTGDKSMGYSVRCLAD